VQTIINHSFITKTVSHKESVQTFIITHSSWQTKLITNKVWDHHPSPSSSSSSSPITVTMSFVMILSLYPNYEMLDDNHKTDAERWCLIFEGRRRTKEGEREEEEAVWKAKDGEPDNVPEYFRTAPSQLSLQTYAPREQARPTKQQRTSSLDLRNCVKKNCWRREATAARELKSLVTQKAIQ
jgi:hypothetical protein